MLSKRFLIVIFTVCALLQFTTAQDTQFTNGIRFSGGVATMPTTAAPGGNSAQGYPYPMTTQGGAWWATPPPTSTPAGPARNPTPTQGGWWATPQTTVAPGGTGTTRCVCPNGSTGFVGGRK